MTDAETLAFYDREAGTYADYAVKDAHMGQVDRFLARLAPGARVLDFGCGSGWAAGRMLAAGMRVEGYDGSEGLATEARHRYGLEVTVGLFSDFESAPRRYDGIWASFSLLHDTRAAMPGHLARLRDALVPGGVIYIGLKEGTGKHRDKLGRRYTYFMRDEMASLLTAAGFSTPEVEDETGIDYSGLPSTYLYLLATRQP